jgi:hypothetical protein
VIKQLLVMGAGCTLFFVQPAVAQTKVTLIKTCSEVAAENDPSIVVEVTVQSHQECGKGEPVTMRLKDRHLGITTMAKTIQNVSSSTRAFDPWERNVFETHEPCRNTYKNVDGTYSGVLIEWLVPKGSACDGRPPGSYYRVYTSSEICIRPKGGCIAVRELTSEGQRRFQEMLDYAFAREVAMN